jgi:DNA end-binding protein Ku
LVSIPVDLYAGTRSGGSHLRMLAPDGTPLARRYFCPDEDLELDEDQLARGYEWQPGKYVVISDDELEALEPKKSRDIELRLFVAADEIDPMYFERSFFLAPASESKKAYRLLVSGMEHAGRAGIATFVMRDKEYLAAIVAEHGWLRAHALRFADEVRPFPALGASGKARPPKDSVTRMERAIAEHASTELNPARLRNESHEKLIELVEEKARRKRDVVEHEDSEPSAGAQIVDLMEVLKRSLNSSSKNPPAARTRGQKETRRRV